MDQGLNVAQQFCDKWLFPILNKHLPADLPSPTITSVAQHIGVVHACTAAQLQRSHIPMIEQRLGFQFNEPHYALQVISLAHPSSLSPQPHTLAYSPSQALTHVSLLVDNEGRNLSYERLEFLGDCILKFVVSYFPLPPPQICLNPPIGFIQVGTHLYRTQPQSSEGALSFIRSHIVSNETLALVAQENNALDISSLILHKIPTSHIPPKVFSDVFEALIGINHYQKKKRNTILMMFFQKRCRVSG